MIALREDADRSGPTSGTLAIEVAVKPIGMASARAREVSVVLVRPTRDRACLFRKLARDMGKRDLYAKAKCGRRPLSSLGLYRPVDPLSGR